MLQKIKTFLFSNQTLRQTVAKNALWLTVSNVLGRLIKAIIIIIAARVLGAADYGAFSYALGLAAFFTIFSDIGVSGILTRETVKHPELRNEYLSTSFFIKIFLLVITVAITIFAAPHFTKIEAAKPLIPIVAFLLAFDSLQSFGFAITRAANRMEVEAWVHIFTNISIVVLGALALAISPTSYTLTIAYTIGSGAGFFAILYILRRQFAASLAYFKQSLVWKIFRSAWPFAMMGLLGSIMINTDIIMLGWFRTAREIGFYAAAQRPVQFLYILPSMIATSLFPVITELIRTKQTERLKIILEKVLATIILFVLPLFFGGLVLARPLIELLFGQEYLPAASSFVILLATILVIYPTSIVGNVVFAYDLQKFLAVATAMGAGGNLILNLLLIPSLGIVGASVATLVAQILSNGYIWFRTRKLQEFHFLKRVQKIVPASLVMTVFTFIFQFLGVNVLLNVALSALLYFALLISMKERLLHEIKSILRPVASGEGVHRESAVL